MIKILGILKTNRKRKLFYAIIILGFVLLIVSSLGKPEEKSSSDPNFSKVTPEAPFVVPPEDQEEEAKNEESFFSVITKDEDTTTSNVYSSTLAQVAKEKVAPHLPIYVEGFETSVGITTSIHIFTLFGDDYETIRVEINRINYRNKEVDPEKSPQITAFIESFEKVKEELAKIGINLADLNVIYGSRGHEQATVEYWISNFKLL